MTSYSCICIKFQPDFEHITIARLLLNAPLEGIPRKIVVYLIGQHRAIKDLCYKTTSVGVEAKWKLCLVDEAGNSLRICPLHDSLVKWHMITRCR